MQERVESGLSRTYIEHRPVERFIINTHAFHNAHLLRAILPRSLVSPIPLHPFDEQLTNHTKYAEAIRVAKAKAQTAKKGGVTNQTENPADSRPNKRVRLVLEDSDEIMVGTIRTTIEL